MNQLVFYPRRLIEVDLPIRRISEHARREKSIRHGHISTLHIWWARRPLAACRAVICAVLWPDPVDELCPQSFRDAAAQALVAFAEQVRSDAKLAELCKTGWSRWNRTNPYTLRPNDPTCRPDMRYALLDFIADFANWDASTVPAFLETSRILTQAAHEALGGIPGTRPLVVDPFAGGGAIPLEALRVGADAFASDLNPVAVLLNKVVLEYIPKYGQKLADEVRKWGQWVKEQAEQELAEFYPQDPDGATPIAYLWARTIICEGPSCGAEVPLIRSLWLAKKGDRSVALRLIPNPTEKSIGFEIIQGVKGKDVTDGTVKRGSATCRCCGYTTPVDSVRRQLKRRKGGTDDAKLLCVVMTKPKTQGRFYRLPNDQDLFAYRASVNKLEEISSTPTEILSFTPDESLDIRGIRHTWAMIYGSEVWSDYFNPRQKVALGLIKKYIAEASKILKTEADDEFYIAVHTCLSLSLSKETDLTNAFCRWKPDAECPVNLFARQAIPMMWDFVETVTISNSSGSWHSMYERTAYAIEQNIYKHHLIGQSLLFSATDHPLPNDSVSTLITDPPYYDAVPYSYLSDFFYVWLKRSLIHVFPDLFRFPLVPKDEEIIVDRPHELSNSTKDIAFYERELTKAFAEGRRIVQPGGIGTIVFASKTTASWEAILQAVIDAGWAITGSWPIDTEMETRVAAQGQARLASSIHLVCRPREDADGRQINVVGDWRDVLQELPQRIHAWMPRLANEGVVGADAIFACLGPALEIFSRYGSVEKADGAPVKLKDYLEYVWAAVANEALSLVFQDADASSLEPDARLTAMWFWTLSAGNAEENGTGGEIDEEAEDDEDEGRNNGNGKPGGYVLEYDAARKIGQGLGAELTRLPHVVEVKGDKARLRSVAERTSYLFGKADAFTPTGKRGGKKSQQLSLFAELDEAHEEQGWGEMSAPAPGKTVLDRVHQAMILFAAGRSEALKRFLVEEGAGSDVRFWKLAQSLSALYPSGTDEKRWVDGVLARKKGLGF